MEELDLKDISMEVSFLQGLILCAHRYIFISKKYFKKHYCTIIVKLAIDPKIGLL